jgi:capsular polysaccharide biosynthesis protein
VELYRYLSILRRRIVLVAATVVLGIIAGWTIAPQSAPYAATATVYVGTTRFNTPDNQNNVSFDRLAALDRILLTYAEMVSSEPIAAAAARRIPLIRSARAILAQTTARAEFGTSLLRVTVADTDPAMAANIANALADELVTQVSALDGPTAVDPASSVGQIPAGLPAYVFARASLPTQPQSTDILRSMLLGGIVGFMIAAAVAFGLEYLDLTVRFPVDAERRLGIPVLGLVPEMTAPRQASATTRSTSHA